MWLSLHNMNVHAVKLQSTYDNPSMGLSEQVKMRSGLPWTSSAESSLIIFQVLALLGF